MEVLGLPEPVEPLGLAAPVPGADADADDAAADAAAAAFFFAFAAAAAFEADGVGDALVGPLATAWLMTAGVLRASALAAALLFVFTGRV